MFQVRIHGRGGQGVVTAAELLSVAAFADGSEAQAFPSFGSERMGAPVVAFCRIDDHKIRLREPIAEPDAVVVQDPTLLGHVDVFGGLVSGGFVLINSAKSIDGLGLAELDAHVVAVPASEIAREHIGRPIPNAALLGALAALTGCVSLDGLDEAIGKRFRGPAADGNKAATHAAFAAVKKEAKHAVNAA